MHKRIINLHLISDSTGETLSSVSRAVMSQFENIEANESWSYKLIRKLVLIRALYAPSKLLLMQDPTNGIEPQYAERLVQYLAQLPNTTCIISSADDFVCKHQIFTHYLLSNGKLEKNS